MLDAFYLPVRYAVGLFGKLEWMPGGGRRGASEAEALTHRRGILVTRWKCWRFPSDPAAQQWQGTTHVIGDVPTTAQFSMSCMQGMGLVYQVHLSSSAPFGCSTFLSLGPGIVTRVTRSILLTAHAVCLRGIRCGVVH